MPKKTSIQIKKIFLDFIKKQSNPVTMRFISKNTNLDYLTVIKYTRILNEENKINTIKVNDTLKLVEAV